MRITLKLFLKYLVSLYGEETIKQKGYYELGFEHLKQMESRDFEELELSIKQGKTPICLWRMPLIMVERQYKKELAEGTINTDSTPHYNSLKDYIEMLKSMGATII